jgi:hypothetical protein
MKIVKNIKIGQVVEVPTYCFAPYRSGWNGWLFTRGIVKGFGTSKKDGRQMVKVEFPTNGYAQAYRTRNGGFKIGERTTIEKWFITSAIFETDIVLPEYPRDRYETPSYNNEIEFLIDKGIIADPFPQ